MMSRYFTVEILTKYIHAVGEERQVDPDVWHDGLYHVLREGPWASGSHKTEEEARHTIERLKHEAQIPSDGIRLTQTDITELPL